MMGPVACVAQLAEAGDGDGSSLGPAIAAVASGGEAVVILDGRRPPAMLVELFTDHGAGTLISA